MKRRSVLALMGSVGALAILLLAVTAPWFLACRDSVPSSSVVTDEAKAIAVLTGHQSRVISLAYSPDGILLASSSGGTSFASQDTTVRLWDVASGQLACMLPSRDAMFNLCFSPEGTSLAGNSYTSLTVWNVSRREVEQTFTKDDPITSLALSPDDKVGFSTYRGRDSTLYVRSRAEGTELTATAPGEVTSAQFSGLGGELWTGGAGEVRVWDTEAMRVVAVFPVHKGRVLLALAPQRAKGASTGSIDGWICVWDTAQKRIISRVAPSLGIISGFAMSPDGLVLAVGKGTIDDQPGVLVLLDTASGKVLATLRCHKGPVQSLAFSPDGKHLASAGYLDSKILIWDVSQLVSP